MKARALLFTVAAVVLTAGPIGVAPLDATLELPTAQTALAMLNDATHFSELVDVPRVPRGTSGRERVQAYVSYPDRTEKAPVVLVTARHQGFSDWVRAVGSQMARDGFIAIVPDDTLDDVLDRNSPVRAYAASLHEANGRIATLDFYEDIDGTPRIAASVDTPAGTAGNDIRMANFTLASHGWASALAFLREETGNRFVADAPAHMAHAAMEAMAQERGRGGRGGEAGRGGDGGRRPGSGLNEKREDLPANWVMAKKAVAQTPRKHEWVDLAVGSAKVRAWVVYPDGNQKAPAVIVLHGATGATDNMKAVADQLAHDGFIGILIDMASGLGPNGGNFDAIPYPDEVMMATGKLGREGVFARIKATYEYAAKHPRSNGKVATLGFCGGGGNSFRSAADVPGLNAAVVFYGQSPDAATLANVKAPVIGFYGENDVRVTESVAPAQAEMKKLGKVYEPNIYPRVTHSFLMFQDLGDNFLATEDSWAKTNAFLKKHLM